MLRRAALALPALLALPLAARAQAPQQQAPLDFIKAIYEPYKRADFKGQSYWEAQRFFTPDLAFAIERDMAESRKRKQPPTLDGDPFVDAQDWHITSLSYSVAATDAKAAVGVAFLSQGEPRSLAVTLVKLRTGWRIFDIVGSGRSLRELYKLK